jgi:hypothetical protein
MPHPSQELTLSFLPRLLVQFCHDIVEKHHKTHGYSSFVKQLWHRDTNGFIAIHKDLFAFFHNAELLWRIRRFCFIVTAGLLITSFATSCWWVLLALIPLLLIVRSLTKRINTYCNLIAGLILAVEIAGNDFGGWVTELPDVRSTASDRLREYFLESKTLLLDFYMPNRAEVSQSELERFAAVIKTEFDQGQAEHIRNVEAIFEK